MTPFERSQSRRKLWLVAFTAALFGAAAEFYVLQATGHICTTGLCVDVAPPDVDLGQ